MLHRGDRHMAAPASHNPLRWRVLCNTASDLHGTNVHYQRMFCRTLYLAHVINGSVAGWYHIKWHTGRYCTTSVPVPVFPSYSDWHRPDYRREILDTCLDDQTARLIDASVWVWQKVIVVVDVLSREDTLRFVTWHAVMAERRPYRRPRLWSSAQADAMQVHPDDLLPASIISRSGVVRKWRHERSGELTRQLTGCRNVHFAPFAPFRWGVSNIGPSRRLQRPRCVKRGCCL